MRYLFMPMVLLVMSTFAVNVSQSAVDPFAPKKTDPFAPANVDPFAPVPPKPNKVNTFRVSQVGADKTELLHVFERVKELKPSLPPVSFEVLQRLSSTEFLVYKLKTESHTQASGSASYGGGGGVYSYTTTRPDLSQVYCLRVRSPISAVDGERIKDLPVMLTDEIKTYQATTGAQKSVRIFSEPESQNVGLTKEDFVSRLRAGEEWLIPDYAKEECFTCGGTGKLSDFRGGGTCNSCRGVGSETIGLLVKW